MNPGFKGQYACPIDRATAKRGQKSRQIRFQRAIFRFHFSVRRNCVEIFRRYGGVNAARLPGDSNFGPKSAPDSNQSRRGLED
jgi:hypothetical protein